MNEVEENKSFVEKITTEPKLLISTISIIAFIGLGFIGLKVNISYDRALSAYNNRDYGLAVTHIYKVNNLFPYFKDAPDLNKKIYYSYYVELGDKKYQEKKYEEALKYYNDAKTYNSTDEIASKINLANIAIEELKKAEKLRLEKERKAKIAKLNSLKSNMRFIKDKVENITYIQDKTSSQYVNSNSFYLYIAENKYRKDLWLRISYTGDNWIFFNKIIFNIDGHNEYISLSYYDVEKDNNYGVVWEYVNLDYSRYKNLIEKIINSKSTIMRLSGERYYDKTITSTEKQALIRVLEYYSLSK